MRNIALGVLGLVGVLTTSQIAIAEPASDPRGIWLTEAGDARFHNMKPNGDHWSGRIYNADDGKTYASDVAVIDGKTLKVSGCLLFICGSERWTKISEAEKMLPPNDLAPYGISNAPGNAGSLYRPRSPSRKSA